MVTRVQARKETHRPVTEDGGDCNVKKKNGRRNEVVKKKGKEGSEGGESSEACQGDVGVEICKGAGWLDDSRLNLELVMDVQERDAAICLFLLFKSSMRKV